MILKLQESPSKFTIQKVSSGSSGPSSYSGRRFIPGTRPLLRAPDTVCIPLHTLLTTLPPSRCPFISYLHALVPFLPQSPSSSHHLLLSSLAHAPSCCSLSLMFVLHSFPFTGLTTPSAVAQDRLLRLIDLSMNDSTWMQFATLW